MSLTQNQITNTCSEFWALVRKQGTLVNNADGTLSVFINYNGDITPVQITKQCCDVLATSTGNNYFFDLDNQKCRWAEKSNGVCDNTPFKIIMNPKGNDGSIFYVENDENCFLSVEFDYLFKLDCQSLSNSLLNVSPVNIELTNEINTLEQQLSEQLAICELNETKIKYYLETIEKTNYSINCQKFPVKRAELPLDPIQLTELEKVPFTKTGFGSVAPFSFPRMAVTYISVNFCINEPDGLNVWASILGPDRYNRFLDGDPTSYNCKHVISFYDQNANNLIANPTATPYFFECDTPFGTKTQLVKALQELYLIKNNCDKQISDLQSQIDVLQANLQTEISSCNSPIAIMESLDVSMTIDIVETDGNLTSVYEQNIFPLIGSGNLYNYLLNNTNSGFYVCGQPNQNETWVSGCTPLIYSELTNQTLPEGFDSNNVTTCLNVKDFILQELFNQSELGLQDNGQEVFYASLSPKILASDWLSYSVDLTDSSLISTIKNKKIKISLKVNNSCGDFCILVDKIKLNQNCTDLNQTNLFITKSPGFNITKVIDNKKSWINNDSLTQREFNVESVLGNSQIRQTDYNTLDERLVINTKEIDLNINIAKAVEYDIWSYITDNPCILTGITNCVPCVILDYKQFQDDEFVEFQDSIPYDFMDTDTITNINSSLCCGDNLIEFDKLLTTNLTEINSVDNFKNVLISELIDVKNRKTISSYPTLKALYERYLNSVNYCGNDSSAFNYYSIEQFANLIGDYWVDLIEQVIPATTIWGSVKVYTNTIFDQQKFKYKSYSSLFGGNPFQGLNVLSPINGVSGQCQDVEVITTVLPSTKQGELKTKPVYNYTDKLCIAQMNWGSEFIGTVKTNAGEIITEPEPINCLMSEWTPWTVCSGGTQSRTRTIITPAANGGKECEATYEERSCVVETKTCWYSMQEHPEYMMSMTCDLAGWSSTTVSIESFKVNGVQYITTPLDLYMDADNLNWVPANNSIISGCTLGGVTGWTYTNFVDFLNSAFTMFNLVDYNAEVALDEVIVTDNLGDDGFVAPNGFYLTTPIGDTFEIKTTSSSAVIGFNLTYTQDDLIYDFKTLNNNEPYNYGMTCNL